MTHPGEQRLLYIDLAKGLTMLAILWGHVMLTGRLNTLVYAFHVPVFFFLSGMVFCREKYPAFRLFLKRRSITLLAPYVLFSAITWVWWLIDSCSKGQAVKECWKPLVQTLIAQGSAGYLIHNPPLWFVTCLFIVEVLYYFTGKLPRWANLLVCLALAWAGWFMMQPNTFFDFKLLPWNIEVAFAALIFYSLGNLAADRCDHGKLISFARKRPCALLPVLAASFVLLYVGAMSNGHVTMAQGALGNNGVVFFLVAGCGILFTLGLCVLLESMYGRWSLLDRVLGFFLWFGRNSFYVMALHIPVMLICVRVISAVTGASLNDVRYAYRYTIPAWVGMIIGSAALVVLITAIRKKAQKRRGPAVSS